MRPSRSETSRRGLGAALVGLLFVAAAGPARAGFELRGFAAARGGGIEGRPSWLEGGFGRLSPAGETPDDADAWAGAEVRLGLDVEISPTLRLFVHAGGRAEPGESAGDAAGLVEAYAEATFANGEAGRLRLRLGQSFLPTSLENVEALWTSPYTLTFSALNSWIGEEVRPLGLDGDQAWQLANGDRVSFGATVFGGNDSSGALLAWRGWSFGNRLTYTGEQLPLPPLPSLADPAQFGDQRDDGSRPFGADLDGRPGWSARARWQRPDKLRVQAAWIDTRGDRRLHRGEYAWQTRFAVAGAEWRATSRLILVAEHLEGSTGMGVANGAFVDASLRASYLLVSWQGQRSRLSLRHDRFATHDEDGSIAELNTEDGRAWTVAGFLALGDAWRLGAELLDSDSQRPAAGQLGQASELDGRSLTLEVRWRF